MASNSAFNESFEEYRRKYPAWITVQQAAEIAQVPVATIYDWSSRGKFNSFKLPCGRFIRLNRDAFVHFLFGGDGPAGVKG